MSGTASSGTRVSFTWQNETWSWKRQWSKSTLEQLGCSYISPLILTTTGSLKKYQHGSTTLTLLTEGHDMSTICDLHVTHGLWYILSVQMTQWLVLYGLGLWVAISGTLYLLLIWMHDSNILWWRTMSSLAFAVLIGSVCVWLWVQYLTG